MTKILIGQFLGSFLAYMVAAQSAYIRINQAGYLPADSKIAVVISKGPVTGKAEIWSADKKKRVATIELGILPSGDWGGKFTNFASIDFTKISSPGRYYLLLQNSDVRSTEFTIGAYPAYQEDLLFFMRQQRCGYNPFLDAACHTKDGKSFFAPVPDGTFVDATGGWHDAGDQLKYLITASNATARMMLAYELGRGKFADNVDALGRDKPNGMPDVLDEARWGLDWIFKLHPAPDRLFHQVADDRDHRGFKLPAEDNADYGWGPKSFRPVYFADGKPQGLSQYKSRSTGVANIAGRSAAAMAMCYRVWKNDLKDGSYA